MNLFWEGEAGNQEVLVGPERMNWIQSGGEDWTRRNVSSGNNDVLVSFFTPGASKSASPTPASFSQSPCYVLSTGLAHSGMPRSDRDRA